MIQSPNESHTSPDSSASHSHRPPKLRAGDIKPSSRIMSPITITAQTRLVDALRLMRSRDIHHLVVVDGKQVMGVVSDRNIFKSGMTSNDALLNPIMTVKDVMIPMQDPLDTDADLSTALTLMHTYDATALPLSKDGKLVGIITESDLLFLLEQWLKQTHSQPSPGEASKPSEMRSETEVFMANPLVQNIMHLLGQAGI